MSSSHTEKLEVAPPLGDNERAEVSTSLSGLKTKSTEGEGSVPAVYQVPQVETPPSVSHFTLTSFRGYVSQRWLLTSGRYSIRP